MPKGKGSRRGATVFHRRTPYAATDVFLKTVDDCMNSSSSAGDSHAHQSMMNLSPLNTKDEQILEQNGIDLKSMGLKAAEELSKRPKKGQIYAAVTADVGSINARLKHLSVSVSLGEASSIDEGLEIADAASLLKLLDRSNREIEMAGQMAQSGALLMVQAQMMFKKGQELLDQSKRKLQSVDMFEK